MKRNRKLVLILALITAAVYYLLPSVEFYSMTDDGLEAMGLKAPEQLADLKNRSLNLGLDLQGGIHLVLEVKTEGMEQQEAQDAVAQAQEVIRNPRRSVRGSRTDHPAPGREPHHYRVARRPGRAACQRSSGPDRTPRIPAPRTL